MNEELKLSSESGPGTDPLAGYLEVRRRWVGDRSPQSQAWRVSDELTEAMDHCLRELLATSRVTVLAVGGYGARHLCQFSDIDLLLLHHGDGAEEARGLLYPLWNAGIKAGHALRTPREAITQARHDLTALCSLLTLRHVAGPESRAAELTDGLTRLLRNERAGLGQLLAEEEQVLWGKESFLRQDPDLKESRGGLRSLDRLAWERARRRLLGEPVENGSEPEAEDARRVLISARAGLHAVERRAANRYALELRTALGEWLGRPPLDVAGELYRAMTTVDRLAGLRFGHGRTISTDPVVAAGQGIIRFVRDRWSRPAAGTRPAPPLQQARAAALASGGRLNPFGFRVAANSPPPEWNEGDRRALVDLLSRGRAGWEAINSLWEAGWWPRALPELAHLRGLAQAAPFHHHPADVHLGRTVTEVLELADGSVAWCAEIIEEAGPLDELLLAAFLHDAGKGLAGDHSATGAVLARQLLARVGFQATTADLVSLLVRHHLLLPETAFRGDLDDPEVIGRVIAVLPDQHHLRLLTVLSVADARATGNESWTSWRGHLLQQLYQRAATSLDPDDPDIAVIERARLHADLEGRVDAEAVEAHLAGMPSGYLLNFGPEVVAEHLLLVYPRPGADEVRVAVNPGAPVATLTVVARDRPGLLATIAGVLALHNLAVLEARVATRPDGVALDIFRVVDARGGDMIGPARWPGVREDLERAVAGGLDLMARLAEKRAAYGDVARGPAEVTTNRRGSQVTVEVRSADRIGFLHDLARLLTGLSLDVKWAKIDTRGLQVVDVFSVFDRIGEDPGRDETIRTVIASAGQSAG